MKKTFRKSIALILTVVTLLSTVSIFAVSASAANYDTNYYDYNQPEASDFARWSGVKVVKGSGTSKNEIKWMQAALNYCIKYRGLKASCLAIDGSFGPSSKNATKAFQRAYGLSVDGSFGPATIAQMKIVLSDGFVRHNFKQINESWSEAKKYNGSYLKGSGCGILSIVNAVYNLGGGFIDPIKLADWAYDNRDFNQSPEGGGGICDRTIFKKAADTYGAQYGFQYVGSASAGASSSMLKKHIQNGGTAIVHVPNHYMCIVDYKDGKYLVFDPAPNSGRRVGITAENGSWKTVSQLSEGCIKIDAFWLYSAR